ncbi:MAG: HAD-IA family hydrolase [Syntrophaceticus schinkii]|jgi:pyrophosphatase PpaX|nr:HAD-IA family hydrolase [Syntrophaceticus schinkii]MDD4262047.1 HAD-IA family hydrolase [Syntrophaceticus schinkii]
MLKAILFDLDGTLIDSIPLIRLSFEHTFKHLGLPWGQGEVLNTIGLPLRDVAKHYAPENYEEFLAVYAEFQVKTQEKLLKPFPEAKRTLNHIQEKGYRTGVVTSKRRKATRESLSLTGLDKYLEVVVAVEDAGRPKPNPDSILKALEQLDIPPAKGVYIGDSIYDIITGKNAGVATIGVTWGIAAKDDLKKQQPDFLVDSWKELRSAIGVQMQGGRFLAHF